MNLFYNHHLVNSQEICLSPDDRAFRYGDGVFETMVGTPGGVRLWPYHWERLQAAMAALQLIPDAQFSSLALHQQAIRLSQDLGQARTRLRLHVWRAPGGLYTPSSTDIHYLLRADPYHPSAPIVPNIALSETVQLQPSAWSRYKTHNALPYVMAGLERQQRGLDDLLIPDTQGHVAEATYSNVFWKTGSQWYTPSLDSGCLDGVMRRHVLTYQRSQQHPVQEGLFPHHVLNQASVIVLTNANSIRYVAQLGTQAYATTDLDVEAWKAALDVPPEAD